MIVEEEGVKKVKWSWRRRFFRWEVELVDICNGVVLGTDRSSNGQDRWNEDHYTVKKAYDLLTREETEGFIGMDAESDYVLGNSYKRINSDFVLVVSIFSNLAGILSSASAEN
ncbi:hypothetical protein P8452_75357 [Trifolium repens]|nr:hypothetical protein P8452_75357 [Trifolium repens]